MDRWDDGSTERRSSRTEKFRTAALAYRPQKEAAPLSFKSLEMKKISRVPRGRGDDDVRPRNRLRHPEGV